MNLQMIPYRILNFITLSILVVALPATATSFQKEKIGAYGYIDWISQTVYATGLGVVPKDKSNSTQAMALAERAAIVVAQRNLLEVIKGVHIDSHTVVEKKIVADEWIISTIQGMVRFSQVEYSKQLSKDTVEVGVSMPLTGELGGMIFTLTKEPGERQQMTGTTSDLESRLDRLERRIQMLEEEISGLRKISLEKERLMFLFQELALAWQAYAVHQTLFVSADYASDTELSVIRNQMNDQEKRLAVFSSLLTDLSRRLDILEAGKQTKPDVQSDKEPYQTPPYTGLVIDARQIGFKPCLRPKIFSRGEQLYPGAYVDLEKAVKNGYVRYFNNNVQAQQSQRAGSLPYVISAEGTAEGDRGLSLDPESYPILKAIIESPSNFLADCRVVIVF